MKSFENLMNVVTNFTNSNQIYLNQDFKPGDLLKIVYKTSEGTKEKNQRYEALLLAINNKGISKSMTLRRNIQGVSVEQIIMFNSPHLLECKKYSKLKVRRAKLYFLRKKNK